MLLKYAAVAAALVVPMSAGAATINFDTLPDGPLTTISEAGFMFELSSTGANSGAALFDTTCTGYGGSDGCNGDADLQPTGGDGAVAGNVLILQSDREGLSPNDDMDGGSITFTLLAGPAFSLTGFSAVDDGTFTAFQGGSELGSISLAGEGETGMTTFASSLFGVGDSFTFVYSGSGGIDALELSEAMPAPIPVPAALPLAAAAFGLLGWIGRRRSA